MAASSGKKLQKHCRIFVWVEGRDPGLAQAIRDLCLEGALAPSKASPGVTFVYPTAPVRDEIVDKAYSADAEEALRLLDAYIIPQCLPSAADFRQVGGNRLGVQLRAVATEKGCVRLEGGALLRPAKDFSPLRKDNIAVWEAVEGALPTEGPSAPKRVAARGGGRVRRRGGAEPPQGPPPIAREKQPLLGDWEHLSARANIAIQVEAKFDKCMQKDGCRAFDPYLDSVASLLLFLKEKDPDRFVGVLPLLDRDPVTCFYILLEPYKTRGTPLLPDDLLFGRSSDHWNGADSFLQVGPPGTGALATFEGFFASLPDQAQASATVRGGGPRVAGGRSSRKGAPRRGGGALDDEPEELRPGAPGGLQLAPGTISAPVPRLRGDPSLSAGEAVVPLCFTQPGALRTAIDLWRTDMLGFDGQDGNFSSTPAKVRETYINAIANNRYPDKGPVFPDWTIEMLGDPLRKLWQDELRIVLHSAMEDVREQPVYSSAMFVEIVRMLRFTRPGNDWGEEASISNPEALKANVDRRAEYDYLLRFINSTDFHYFAVPTNKVGRGESWGNIPLSQGKAPFQDPDDLSVANTELTKAQRLARARKGGMDRSAAYPPGIVRALREYVRRNNSLPPQLGVSCAELSLGPPGAFEEPPDESSEDEPPPPTKGGRRR